MSKMLVVAVLAALCGTPQSAAAQSAPMDIRSPRSVAPSRLDPAWAIPVRVAPAPRQSMPQGAYDPRRQVVSYHGPERPGTIIVDTGARYLYFIQDNGAALRYGIGVPRRDLNAFRGEAVVQHKREWPSWTPTVGMIRREPWKNAQWARGMPGGIQNPLGARALYLYRGGRDTMLRIHGTNESYTIGLEVSSGCFRLTNEDIIDLYGRVEAGTPVVVR